MTILVTGGSGFIGSHFIDYLLNETHHAVINFDTSKDTRYWSLNHLHYPKFRFIQGNITDRELLTEIFLSNRPQAVINFASTHELSSSPPRYSDYISTNILGTEQLLTASLDYWRTLVGLEKIQFRYLQVSTGAVYGEAINATEDSPYQPISPYSASKAAGDHLVRAWHRTYGLPILITCGSETYGARQATDSFIPDLLRKALAGNPLPLHGDGTHKHDWIHVSDHAYGIYLTLKLGRIGESYNISASNPVSEKQLIYQLCDLLDEFASEFHELLHLRQFADLVTYIEDADQSYRHWNLDASKIHRHLGWSPKMPFERSIRETVQIYLNGD